MKYIIALLMAALKDKRLHIAPLPDGAPIYVLHDPGPFDCEPQENVAADSYVHGYTEFVYGEYGIGWHQTREHLLQLVGKEALG